MKIGRMKNKNGITLIALIITIIVMLILAGIVLSLTISENGIMKKAEESGIAYSEKEAREKLELVLLDMQADKIVNSEYNQDEYLTAKIEENGMFVNGKIVFVNGWKFEINRDIPEISRSLGKQEMDNGILELTLDKKEIIIGLTNQEGIQIPNTDQIKVITENISKDQYKWRIEDSSIASIDQDGKVTAIARGNTVIKCVSIDGSKIYAICNLIVEEREYLYYRGKSIVEFEEPICGSHGTLAGAPYFREEYIYTNFSNPSSPNECQYLNIITKNKIDFSKYKGIGINAKKELTGLDGGVYMSPVQGKICNSYGQISDILLYCINRENQECYFDISDISIEAYLDTIIRIGEYLSGVASEVDTYIYGIYLVK